MSRAAARSTGRGHGFLDFFVVLYWMLRLPDELEGELWHDGESIEGAYQVELAPPRRAPREQTRLQLMDGGAACATGSFAAAGIVARTALR